MEEEEVRSGRQQWPLTHNQKGIYYLQQLDPQSKYVQLSAQCMILAQQGNMHKPGEYSHGRLG